MSLESLIKDRIKREGPISIAEFMQLALTHPEFGYYMRKDPLGIQGDFITAPEVSQIFGEVIGLWLSEQWRLLGKPKTLLAELGPGRGTLMNDILRATKPIAGFHEAITIWLVEASPSLKQKQWQALSSRHPRIEWHERLEHLPDLPLLLIANEFFDALPVRQFIEKEERMVSLNTKGSLAFMPEEASNISEYCEAGIAIIRTISRHLRAHGGAALIIDYGYETGKGDTLQAVKAHHYHPPLSEPGTADLTAHVDFSALKHSAFGEGVIVHGPQPQGQFLSALGATARAARLCEQAIAEQKATILSGLERLLSPDQMGDLFKVLCLVSPGHPKPEGF